jgi:hypothetical protein
MRSSGVNPARGCTQLNVLYLPLRTSNLDLDETPGAHLNKILTIEEDKYSLEKNTDFNVI